MSNSQWQTDPARRRERMTWPSPAQALRQMGIIILVVAVWSGLLAGCLQLTQPQRNESVATGTQPATRPTDTPAPSPAPAKTTDISFAKDVSPIFQKSCVRCHGSRKSAGLDLQTYASVMKGGQGGPVIKPGKASDSLLVELIVTGEMPQGGPPLSPTEIQTIRAWVEAGAPDN